MLPPHFPCLFCQQSVRLRPVALLGLFSEDNNASRGKRCSYSAVGCCWPVQLLSCAVPACLYTTAAVTTRDYHPNPVNNLEDHLTEPQQCIRLTSRRSRTNAVRTVRPEAWTRQEGKVCQYFVRPNLGGRKRNSIVEDQTVSFPIYLPFALQAKTDRRTRARCQEARICVDYEDYRGPECFAHIPSAWPRACLPKLSFLNRRL